MTREEILDIVIENLKDNVDDLEDIEIDPTQSMADYGAASLDVVEIVSSVMRELRLRIPRTELANLNGINDLVDLLYEKAK